jgi:hypothetical protein
VRPETSKFFEVSSLTYHTPITIESLTYRGVARCASVLFQTRLSQGSLGANVGVNYSRDEASANEVVDCIRHSGPRAVAIRADIGKASDIEELFAASLKESGRLAWVTITIETTPTIV